MIITKTEVTSALAAAEVICHGDVLSNTPVTISQGTLAVLVEAAKCAKYRPTRLNRNLPSGSTVILDDGSPIITESDAD